MDTKSTELAAIESATMQVLNEVRKGIIIGRAIIFSNSQEALRCLQTSGQQSDQNIVQKITQYAYEIGKSGKAPISFQWCPGHSKIMGNDRADQPAQEATYIGKTTLLAGLEPTPTSLSIALAEIKPNWRDTSRARFWFTKSFDKGLPGPHTKALYDGKSKAHSQILCQLRSGKIGQISIWHGLTPWSH